MPGDLSDDGVLIRYKSAFFVTKSVGRITRLVIGYGVYARANWVI
ncbi:hypothetical protein [Thalassospira alkalitolerans]|nr:hypothetical protein [Thalassospira alkalitolerans]